MRPASLNQRTSQMYVQISHFMYNSWNELANKKIKHFIKNGLFIDVKGDACPCDDLFPSLPEQVT